MSAPSSSRSFFATYWIALLALASVLLFAGMARWSVLCVGEPKSEQRSQCTSSTSWFQPVDGCIELLERGVSGTTGACEAMSSDSALGTWWKNGWRYALYNVDNLFVVTATLVFVATAFRCSWRFSSQGKPDILGLALLLSLAVALGYAACDLGENLWSIAHVGVPNPEGVEAASLLTLWKFRLFAASAVIALMWTFAYAADAMYRRSLH